MNNLEEAKAAYKKRFGVSVAANVTGGYVLDIPDDDAGAAAALRAAVAAGEPLPDYEYPPGADY